MAAWRASAGIPRSSRKAQSGSTSGSSFAATQQTIAAIAVVETKQNETQARAPLTTKSRNLAANQVLCIVGKIQGAGMIAFAHDATALADFEALGAHPKKTKKNGATSKSNGKPAPQPSQPVTG